MSDPAVSVVIPLYNRAHLIGHTVQSVLERFTGGGRQSGPEPAPPAPTSAPAATENGKAN